MGKAERTMLILVGVLFVAMFVAVLVVPHVPFLAGGE